MIERCHSPNNHTYKRYGGRGITVCDEWRNNFQSFCEWAWDNGYDKDAPSDECTIDRIDNSKGYSPDNCRWVDQKTQARNRRNNHKLEFDGKNLTVIEWSEIVGINPTTLHKRLELGWSIEETLTKPLNQRKSHKRKKGA